MKFALIIDLARTDTNRNYRNLAISLLLGKATDSFARRVALECDEGGV